MRIASIFFAVLFLSLCVSTVSAQSEDYSEKNEIGIHALLGGASVVKYSDLKPRFAGGMGFTLNHRVSAHAALQFGTDIVGKGYRFNNSVVTRKDYIKYLEMPIGVLFFAGSVRIGIDLVPSFAVAGKTKLEMDGEENEAEFNDESWDIFKRFNLNGRFSAGYGFNFRNIIFIPAVLFEMETLNSQKEDTENSEDVQYRHINLMLSAGIHYSL